MKQYILFSEEELSDLGKGDMIDFRLPSEELVCFMCAERYVEMLDKQEDE